MLWRGASRSSVAAASSKIEAFIAQHPLHRILTVLGRMGVWVARPRYGSTSHTRRHHVASAAAQAVAIHHQCLVPFVYAVADLSCETYVRSGCVVACCGADVSPL
jgi:hypothetical protein